MVEAVLTAVTSALTDAGLNAQRQFPDAALCRGSGALVCVGVKQSRLLSAGCGEYLGRRTVDGAPREVYGWRLEGVLALDIYSPEGSGPALCQSCFEALSSALAVLPSGLRQRELRCGETVWDESTGMFLCRCELSVLALLTREESAEDGVFTDFVLRGVMK